MPPDDAALVIGALGVLAVLCGVGLGRWLVHGPADRRRKERDAVITRWALGEIAMDCMACGDMGGSWQNGQSGEPGTRCLQCVRQAR